MRERATILPLGTYGDGTTRAAWPGVIYEPAAAAKRLVDYFMGGNYRPGDDDATRQLAEDSFTAASAVPVAGLAAAAVRPRTSLGSGGGRLVKGDMPTYKGYHATRDASKFVGDPEDRYIPSTMWIVGARDEAAKQAANTYVDHGLAAKAKAIIPVEGRFENPLVVDADGAKWKSIPFEEKRWRSEDLSREARNRGHDALVLENIRDHHAAIGDEPPTRVIAALRHGTVYDDYGNLLFSNSSKASAPGLAALESNRVRGYHGTRHGKVVADPDHPDKRHFDAFYMTGGRSPDDAALANGYAMQLIDEPYSNAVVATEARFSNPMLVDAEGRMWNDLPGDVKDLDDLARSARSKGHDGLVVQNVYDLPQDDFRPTRPLTTVAALRRGTVFDDHGRQIFSNPSTAAVLSLMQQREKR